MSPAVDSGGPVTCVYRAYEGERVVATGRLTLESLPAQGDEVTLNGRRHVVRSIEFGSGDPALELEPHELTPG
jgi:hypothetical protein